MIDSIISYRRLLNNDDTIKIGLSIPTEEDGSDPRLSIIIEHPLLTSRSLYKRLALIFGEDDLQLEHIWGELPRRSYIRPSAKYSTDEIESENDGQWDAEVDDNIDSDDDDDSTMRRQPPKKTRSKQPARLSTTTTIPPSPTKYQSHHKSRLPTTSLAPVPKKSKHEGKRSLQFGAQPGPSPKKRKGKKERDRFSS